MLVPTAIVHKGIPTWSSGTDAEIVDLLYQHYHNQINIYDYWSVGDERVVHLNAMESLGDVLVNDTHVAQDITLVLLNKGGKELVTPIGGHTECAFTVGQKNKLLEGGRLWNYYGAQSKPSGWSWVTAPPYSWDTCERRTWCNTIYKNAFPSKLQEIFKHHKNISGSFTSNPNSYKSITTNDYFEIPDEKELFGDTTEGCVGTSNSPYFTNQTIAANNTWFEYYQTVLNRFKLDLSTGSLGMYPLRSTPYKKSYNNGSTENVTYSDASYSFIASYERKYNDGGMVAYPEHEISATQEFPIIVQGCI